jgi:hypothetical protein
MNSDTIGLLGTAFILAVIAYPLVRLANFAVNVI